MRKFLELRVRLGVALFIVLDAIALLSPPIYRSNGSPFFRNALTDQAGQLIILGFSGASHSSPGFRRVVEGLEGGAIGGVLFLPHNIASRAELETMIRQIKQCACSVAPLIAVDEEGGAVERLGEEYGFPHVPSPAEVGSGSESAARREYKMLAQKLANLGFNMNFAPVVDLNTNPVNPIIGARGRSFSRDPVVVERFAKIFIEEHRAAGVLTTLKHFPGHGSSTTDPHKTATDVGSTWTPDELIPYRGLLAAGSVDAIMAGHLINEAHWGGAATQEGATAIARILRDELKYEGVVISDDLTMDAVWPSKTDFAPVLRSSLKAGVDIALVAHPTEEDDGGLSLNSSLAKAISAGEISYDSIKRSWERVVSLKAGQSR
jgi:beta-N-acetylhexosaminidase